MQENEHFDPMFFIVIGIVVGFVAALILKSPTPQAAPPVIVTATAIQTPSMTATATETRTPTPTATSTATATPSMTPTATELTPTQEVLKYYTPSVSLLNYRAGPGTDYTIFGQLKRGDMLLRFGSEGDWWAMCRVELVYPYTCTGTYWVASWLLQEVAGP